ncbi:MAG: tyrosine recombinase XerC [Tannerella sp.]|jgi:integrase/recombinase XerC|nr:tyrosine recombinase XerC [Tannerella sp.]
MERIFEPFLDYLRYERGYSAHTVEAYRRDLSQFYIYYNVRARGKEFVPEAIESDEIRDWLASLLQEGITARSVNRKLSALRSYFKYLLKRDAVANDPLRLINGPKSKAALPSFIDEKDMSELLDGEEFDSDFAGIRDRLMMELLYETGIRRAELVGIRRSDIDMDAMTLKVTGKRNKQRLIPFAGRLKRMLESYLEQKDKTIADSDSLLFVRANGKPLTVNIIYYLVKKRLGAVSAAGKRSPHVLRHTFATSMLNNGAELNAVKELLGHSSLASTAVYTHLTFEDLKRVYNAHPRAQKTKEVNYGNQN